MNIALVVAKSHNNVIGKNGVMPWRLSSDLKRFKQITKDSIVIMGRKTFESIGKPLPDRINIIITTNKEYSGDGCFVVHSIDEALQLIIEGVFKNYQNIFFIGGESIYKEVIPICDKMYITEVDCNINGDTYFPEFDVNEWDKYFITNSIIDKKNDFNYQYFEYIKKC